jgi:hypothetical protein
MYRGGRLALRKLLEKGAWQRHAHDVFNLGSSS